MFDAGAFDSCGEIVAHLVLIVAIELPTQEGGHLIRLHGVNGRPREDAVDFFQVLLFPEHDVS